MPDIPSILEMFKAGLHFGHQVSRRHPKMEPYIYTQKNSVHIINLEITQQKLKEAVDFVKKTIREGGTILFLGTKKQAQQIIKDCAIKCNSPYVVERWLGGTFTNFKEILKIIRKFTDLKKKRQLGELSKYTKKERLEFDREIEKLEKLVGGIEKLQKLPSAIFILDLKREKSAVAEANKMKIPIIGVCDTNTNPDKVDYIIPANDDSVKGIRLIADLLSNAILETMKDPEKKATATNTKNSK